MGGNPYLMKFLSLAANLAILAMVFGLLERAFALKSLGGRRGGWFRDLAYYFNHNLVLVVVVSLLGALIASGFNRILPAGYRDWVAGWPTVVRGLVFFVVVEIGFYWGHRWSHTNAFLWRFHAVHHSAEHMDWLANTRGHPVDVIFGRMMGLVPAFALGLSASSAAADDVVPQLIVIFTGAWSFFIHANVKWRFGPLEWLIATPAFHHWHHTNDEHRDHNYASTLPWLDALFGTMHLPRREWPPEYGIDDKTMPADLIGQLVHPLRR